MSVSEKLDDLKNDIDSFIAVYYNLKRKNIQLQKENIQLKKERDRYKAEVEELGGLLDEYGVYY